LPSFVVAPTPATSAPAVAAAVSPPRYNLLWSDVVEHALATLRALTHVAASDLAAVLQPAPVDALIPSHPPPWVPEGTPPPVPTGVDLGGVVAIQPVAIISPSPSGAEIRGQQAILPSVVLEFP
jgi:hypothetical protein